MLLIFVVPIQVAALSRYDLFVGCRLRQVIQVFTDHGARKVAVYVLVAVSLGQDLPFWLVTVGVVVDDVVTLFKELMVVGSSAKQHLLLHLLSFFTATFDEFVHLVSSVL